MIISSNELGVSAQRVQELLVKNYEIDKKSVKNFGSHSRTSSENN